MLGGYAVISVICAGAAFMLVFLHKLTQEIRRGYGAAVLLNTPNSGAGASKVVPLSPAAGRERRTNAPKSRYMWRGLPVGDPVKIEKPLGKLIRLTPAMFETRAGVGGAVGAGKKA